MKKRLLALLLSLCLLASLIPASVMASPVELEPEVNSFSENILAGENLTNGEENEPEVTVSEDVQPVEVSTDKVLSTETGSIGSISIVDVMTVEADAVNAAVSNEVQTTAAASDEVAVSKTEESTASTGNADIDTPNNEDESKDVSAASAVSEDSSAQSDSNMIYIPRNTTSISLDYILLPEGTYSSTARLQLIDASGELVATTNGENFKVNSEYVTGYNTLYFVKNPQAGNCSIQVTDGTAAEPITTELSSYSALVVDDPVIYCVSLDDALRVGDSSIAATLYFYNFSGDPDDYVLKLYDPSNAIVAESSSHTGIGSAGEAAYAGYTLNITGDIAADQKYSLSIERKSGQLYSSADHVSIIAEAAEEAVEEDTSMSISDVEEDSTLPGRLIIKTANTSEDQTYTLTVTENNNELYNATVSPNADGIIYVTLTKDGLLMPLSIAYESCDLKIELSDGESSDWFWFSTDIDSTVSPWVSGSLTECGSNQYSFTLKGINMLRDIYDADEISFTLRKENSETGAYDIVGTTSGQIKKSLTTDYMDEYIFSGVFTTASALESDSYYIYYGDEAIDDVYLSSADAAHSLSISRLSISNFKGWNSYTRKYTFWFNFGVLPCHVELSGSSGEAKLQLIDADGNVASESETAIGTLISGSTYDYEFIIPYNSGIINGASYWFRVVDEDEVADYGYEYDDYVYTDSVEIPTSFKVEKVTEGDTQVTVHSSWYYIQNVSKSDIADVLPVFTNAASNEQMVMTGYEICPVYDDAYCHVTLNFSTPFKFGQYKYIENTEYTWTTTLIVQGSDTPSLGELKSELSDEAVSGTYFENCSKLPDGTYTGIIYGDENQSIELEKSADGSTLTVTSPISELQTGESYKIAVWCGDTFMGTDSFYVRYGAVPADNDSDIIFIQAEYKEKKSDGSYYTYGYPMAYVSPSKEIEFEAYKSGYAYVRFAEADIESAEYVPIRDGIPFTLSDGDGEKTVLVQFKKTSGEESAIHSYNCYLAEGASTELEIISAEVSPDGILPEYTDFTITLVTSSRWCRVYGKPLYNENGTVNEYFEYYHFSYVGPCENGYEFKLSLNTREFSSLYDWTGMHCYADSLISRYNEINADVNYRIGTLSQVEFINIANNKTNYTNRNWVTLSGYASASSTVTVKITGNDGSVQYLTATADAYCKFSVEAYLADCVYTIRATDSNGLSSEYYDLVVDTVAPVVSDLIASAGTSENANVSWVCEDSDVDHYLLTRNGSTIKVAGNVTSYVDIGVMSIGTEYELIAVDKAGNQSEPITAVIGDTIPPTQPGIAAMLSRGTKHIAFNWEKSTDNFAVEKYYVYRNGEEIAVVIADTDDSLPSYTDTGLDEGTAYTYTVKAADAAGNISIASEAAELTTATLNISSGTTLSGIYYRQQLENIRLTVQAQQEEMYDVNKLTAAFEYKLENADEWNTLALDRTVTTGMYTALWDISKIDQGNYNVRITVRDEDETEKTLWEDKIITIKDDDVVPVISMSSPKADSVYGVTQKITVSGSASDNILLSKIVLSYSADGSNFTDITTVSLSDKKSNYYYSFDWIPTGTSGSVTIRATAYDECNNSAYTEQKITVDADAPDDVSDFAVTSTSSYIQLSWSYGSLTSESDFSTFRIYRAESEDGPFSEICRQKAIGYYDDGTTASADTTYYYYVTAVDIYGNESAGSPVKSGRLLTSTAGPTIGDMRPYADAVLCKSAVLRVTAADDYRLSKAVFEYRPINSETWTEIATKNVSGITNNTVFSCNWNIMSFAAGTYEVRVSVYDVSDSEGVANTPAVITRTYSIKAYSAPQSPVLSASSAYKTGVLTWTYDGNADLLDHYNLYCSSSENGAYSLVRTIAKDNTKCQVTLPIGQVYYYKIYAVDAYGAVAQSNVVSVQSIGTDSEAPVAVISPEVLFTAKGISFRFSGVNSTDNDTIVSYNWSFGDGATSTSATPVHVYSNAGSFTVSLTVTDEAGNTNTEERVIEVVDTAAEDCEYTLVTFRIVDASKENTPAIPNALLYITYGIEGFGATTAECDESGTVTLLMPRGNHIVNVTAGKYMPTAKNIKVTEGDNGAMTATIGLSETSLVSGELTATEMTYDEIIEAGIDVSSPANQHVWKFATILKFAVGLKTFELPVITGYRNDAGTFWSGAGGWYSLGGSDGSLGGSAGWGDWTIGFFPMPVEGFYFVIYGEAHWLKEMYNVELLVINNSYTDTINNCVAELLIPEGLSLADMLTEQQSCIVNMGNIDHASEQTARWYVRGDAAGEYYISADVRGELVSDSVTEPFAHRFTTDEPVKVYAGDALKLTITADDVAERGEDYKVVFRLSNVSDKSLYNLSFGITGIEQGKILSITTNDGEKTALLPIESEDFKDSLMRKVDELAPGGYMEIAVTTTCWFNSTAELAAAAAKIVIDEVTGTAIFGQFIDIAYYLDSVSVVTLEGSTTSIPYEVVVNRVERENLIDKIIYGLAEDLFGDAVPILFDGLGGTLIEYVGTDCGMDSFMIEGAKAFLKLQQGETDYTFTIRIDDGKNTENSIYNDYISITSGTSTQAIIDILNGPELSFKNGDISISAKGPGATKFEIEAKDIYGTTVRKYTINLEISDEKMKSTLELSPTGTKVSVETEEFQAVLKERTEADRNLFLRNPCMIFDSEISLEIDDYTSGSSYSVEFNKSDILKLLTESIVTKLTCDGQAAQLGFDRAALQTISDSCGEKVTVSACRLTDEEAQNLGSTQPTYKLAVSDEAGNVVSDFGDGSVFVSLPYELGDSKNLVIEHIKEDGTVELINCVYNSATKTVEFATNGFSYFRIKELDGKALTTEPTVSDYFNSVGSSISASVSGVDDNELVYNWYRGNDFDEPIFTGKTYVLTAADANTTLTVRVYGTQAGSYASTVYTETTITIGALSKDVGDDGGIINVTEGMQGTFVKSENTTGKVAFSFTPEKSGVYIYSFIEPIPSNDEMVIKITRPDLKDNQGNDWLIQRTSFGGGTEGKRTFEAEAGCTYIITFDNSKAGDYHITISYVEPIESVEINETNFPDAAFRQWILDWRDWHSENGSYKKDGKLDTFEIASVFNIYTPSETIGSTYGPTETFGSIEGVKYFKYLENLRCTGHQLTSLPELPESLKYLYCDDNKIASIASLPGNLEVFSCAKNELTSLPALPESLTELNCNTNLLTEVILNSNAIYIFVNVDHNKLPSRDSVKNNNITWDENNFIFGMQNQNYSSDTPINESNFPDATFMEFVKAYDTNGDNALSNIEIAQVASMDISEQGIRSIKGIEYFTSLTLLYCSNNQLAELPTLPDELEGLYCWDNQLTELPTLPEKLESLDCSSNQLTELPTLPKKLESLDCSKNQLTELTTLPETLEYLDCSNNQLTEIPTLPASLNQLICSNNKLTQYNVDAANEYYKSVEGVLYTKDGLTLVNYPAARTGTNITVRSGTTTLSEWAFAGNINADTIVLPASIESIQTGAFYMCQSLETILFNGTHEQWESVCEDKDYLTEQNVKVVCLSMEKTLTDSNDSTTVTVIGYDGAVETAIAVTITEADESTARALLENANIAIISLDGVKAYDITLKDASGAKTQPDGFVQVKLKVPEGYDGTKCVVYHKEEKGTLTPMNAVFEEGYLVFITDSFSIYIIHQPHDTPTGDLTGDDVVDITDLIRLKKFIADDTTQIVGSADLNGDGIVDILDLIRLKKIIAGETSFS